MSENDNEPKAPEGNGAAPVSETGAPAEPAAASAEGDSKATIERLEKEKKETYDRLLRTAADFDNFKKRSRKESQEAEERGKVRVLKEVLPVIDNLERAVAHEAQATAAAGSVVEGVRLVLRQFQSVLEKMDVRPLESIGQPFDPTHHEALQQSETDEVAPGTVVSELQKGYMVGDKLLRPAMVVVAKRASAKAPDGDGNGSAEGSGAAEPNGSGLPGSEGGS